jgi:hypothetical protein
MPIHVSDKQLDQMEKGRATALIVRSERTNKGYALIPESVYAWLQPLLLHAAIDLDHTADNKEASPTIKWSPEKNARRVALINKKHDRGLTPAEKKDLKRLMAEAEAHRDAAAPFNNQILELILAGLRKKPPKSSTR